MRICRIRNELFVRLYFIDSGVVTTQRVNERAQDRVVLINNLDPNFLATQRRFFSAGWLYDWMLRGVFIDRILSLPSGS